MHATGPASLQLQQCCKGCDVRLPLARFTFRSILIRAVLLASAWHVRSFPSPHDPASAICAWLQSARGGRYTRSVHACEHACDKSARGGRHISHLSYVSPDIRLTYVPLVSSMAYDGASASGLGFLFKSLISTPPGRLGESVATAMEA